MASTETKPDIILNSPVGAKPAIYKWPLTYTSKGQKIDGAEEIVETIRWVAREYLEFKPAIENLLPDQLNLKSYDCIKNLCDKYNKIPEMVLKMNKGTSVAPKTSSRASQGLLKHIIQQVYNYAVADPTELNKYSPFSSETYGETTFEFMAQLIEKNQFKPKENDTFIDMGSGVGHIVLQMAASVECKKCYGIEISDVPAGYAKVMEDRFKFWMNWHGKTYTEFELFHGDFFEKKYVDIIKNANFILVNNYAFKPEVDHKLKQRFLDLKDGVQILSSKPFCSPKARVTERHLTDIGSIMRVIEIHPELKKDTVSWTHKPLPYYLHVLDASPVEKYYERKKRRQGRSGERGRPNKRKKVGKGSDSQSDDSEDNIVYGPTTRKAWSEWCNAASASNRASTDSVRTNSSRNNSTDTENYESAIENEENTAATKTLKEIDTHKRAKRNELQSLTTGSATATADEGNISSSATSPPTKSSQGPGQPPKSCLDKKRDYAIRKGGTNLLQSAPPSALYSISKPAESAGSSSSKIPNIVIKVKPPIEAKVSEESGRDDLRSASATNDAAKTRSKVCEASTKKLRQRKKPPPANQPTSQTTNSTKSPQKLEHKAQNQISMDLTTNTPTNGPRSKKASTAAKTSGRPTANSKKKAAPSDKSSSLNLLHAKTVESVTGSAGYFPTPAPGCEDHNLRSITDTPSLPRVMIKDLSMFISDFLGQKTIDRHAEFMKQELDKFAKKLQHSGARDVLMREIEKERVKHGMLTREIEDLSREIKSLNERIPRVMKVHCDDLGIKNTPRSVVNLLGSLLRKHQELSSYQIQLETAHQMNQRPLIPPKAHSNNSSPYQNRTSSSATLDLSLKQAA